MANPNIRKVQAHSAALTKARGEAKAQLVEENAERYEELIAERMEESGWIAKPVTTVKWVQET